MSNNLHAGDFDALWMGENTGYVLSKLNVTLPGNQELRYIGKEHQIPTIDLFLPESQTIVENVSDDNLIEDILNSLIDLTENDLQSMKSMVEYYLENGSRRERRLAKNLNKAVSWIEREKNKYVQKN